MSRAVTSGTKRGYERHWNKWTGFLRTIPEWQRPSEFLLEVQSPSDKVDWLSLFVLHLYEVHGMRGSQCVSSVLSGLRLMCRIRRLDTGFFDLPDLGAVKKGVRPTVAEVCNNETRRAETRKLPAIVEIMAAMRERLWVDTGVDSEGLYSKAIWISALIGFDTGVRPSNVCLGDGKSAVDHCILSSDLVFNVTTQLGNERFRGGEAVRGELEEGYPESIKRVSCVDVSIVTTKITNKSSAGRVVNRIGRGNAFESAAVDDICAFQVLSRVKSTDKFCTRYAPTNRGKLSRKTVINKDLSNAIKDAAESLGLPRIIFSPKSLTSGYATYQVECGVTWEAMTSRGGWSKTSSVPRRHYIFENARGPLCTAVDSQGVVQGLGLEGLKGFLPVGPLSVSRRAEL